MLQKGELDMNLVKKGKNALRGETNFVAIIVIIVIIIAIAAIFRDQLKGAVEAVFGQLNSFIKQK